MSPFDPAGLEERLEKIEKEMNKSGFWDEPEAAQKLMKEKKSVEDKLDIMKRLTAMMEDLEIMVEMAEEENDEELAREAEESCSQLQSQLEQLRLQTLLNGKYDKNNAIISVHAGSGRHRCSGLGGNAVQV